MDRRRLILYLLLNVFISACVTGTILFWYDRNYRSVSVSAVQPAASSLNQGVSAPQATLNPQANIPVEIVSVIGAGTLEAEWVVVSYRGTDPINLANWELRDSNRHVFVFPQLMLHKDGAVQIHTASGTNTVIDLYWGESDPVWESGEEAQLYDPSGNLRASYKVP
ncbi:MAG TPA: lamin tail domain-containing protein [Anaerolineales bacterium]|nr:lamin tail domain-containing protein [Anaerolineales bacterium]HLO31833.1 lamin tail domain-containing protein [Anaerolineales bacterium]